MTKAETVSAEFILAQKLFIYLFILFHRTQVTHKTAWKINVLAVFHIGQRGQRH